MGDFPWSMDPFREGRQRVIDVNATVSAENTYDMVLEADWWGRRRPST